MRQRIRIQLKILHATGKQAVLIVVTAFLTLTFLAPALAGQTSLSLSQAIFNTLDSNPLVSIQKEEIHKSQGKYAKVFAPRIDRGIFKNNIKNKFNIKKKLQKRHNKLEERHNLKELHNLKERYNLKEQHN